MTDIIVSGDYLMVTQFWLSGKGGLNSTNYSSTSVDFGCSLDGEKKVIRREEQENADEILFLNILGDNALVVKYNLANLVNFYRKFKLDEKVADSFLEATNDLYAHIEIIASGFPNIYRGEFFLPGERRAIIEGDFLDWPNKRK